MYGKRVLLVNLVLLVALMVTPSLVMAAPPVPSDIAPVQAPAALAAPAAAPTDMPLTDALRSTLTLKESFTDAQRAAIQAVLEKYNPEFEAITKTLPDLKDAAVIDPAALTPDGRANAPTSAAALKATKNARLALKAMNELAAVQAKVDKELASILTPEQWAKHQAALSPIVSKVEAAKLQAERQSGNSPQYYSTYCYYSGLYASIADAYLYTGYLYAYYNYYYNYYGSYYAYYYLYYAHYYAHLGLQEIGGGYFDLLEWGSDRNDFVYYGWNDMYDAYYYGYYGKEYAYSNYYYYGYTYAYYAYYYGYYGYYYAYYSYIYGYYCYYD